MAANKALRRLVKRIESLKAEIARMEELEEESEYHYQRQIEEVNHRAERVANEARYQVREARDREESRQYEIQDITRKLQNARDRHDSYDCDRYLRRLRNL